VIENHPGFGSCKVGRIDWQRLRRWDEPAPTIALTIEKLEDQRKARLRSMPANSCGLAT